MIDKYKDIFENLSEKSSSRNEGHRTLIVDGTNFFIRVFTAVPVLNSNGEHVGGLYGFLSSLALNIRQYEPDKCIVIFDSKGGSTRRKQIYSDYKANRGGNKTFNRPNEFKDLMDEEEQMKRQFQRIVEYLDILPIHVIAIPHIEADDAIAYMTTHLLKDSGHIRIVSMDRDFLQLVNENVEVYNPTSKKLYNMANIHEKFGVINSNILLCRAIDGDGGDNIGGVSGVGIKTLVKTFPKLATEKCEISEIISECKERIAKDKKPKKIYSILVNNENLINRNIDLMQLHDVDIHGQAKLNIIAGLKQKLTVIDRYKFRKLWTEDYLHTFIRDPDAWLNTNFKKLELNVRKQNFNK